MNHISTQSDPVNQSAQPVVEPYHYADRPCDGSIVNELEREDTSAYEDGWTI